MSREDTASWMPVDDQQLKRLKTMLDHRVKQYNQPSFIAADPVSVPHSYTKKQDREISAFFAAILAWGSRTTIIRNTRRLMEGMDNAPYDFLLHHQEQDLKKFTGFVHRTFNSTDLLYFIFRLRKHYLHFPSLEDAFVPEHRYETATVEQALIRFQHYFFAVTHPERTRKHIATPAQGSACKRLNMFLRWMVRNDKQGVDFGLWKKITPAQLICPLDVHVAGVAARLQLIPNEKSCWKHAVLLTQQLQRMHATDPVVYDYALFGMGATERW